MGFYARRIFPGVVNWVMSGRRFDALRERTLAGVSGRTIEIGFGTGLNLPHYPAGLEALTGVDVNPGMHGRARRRIARQSRRIDLRTADGESLPFGDRQFDSAVSTWTLCSIPRVDRALFEIRRVLKPGGRLFFVEHGLSSDPRIRIWQHRLTPLQKILADGCHLDRDMERLIRAAGFSIVALETFYMDGAPRVAGWLYQGIAESR